MENEEIKRIAEEYVHSILDIDTHDPNFNERDWQDMFDTALDETYNAFKWLNERYCILGKDIPKITVNGAMPKFMLGQMVRVMTNNKVGFVNMITEDNQYKLLGEPDILYKETDLMGYSLY